MNDLLTAVRAGAHRDVPALVLGLDPAGRKAALAELKELRKEVRGWDWQRQDRIRKALHVAGAGCHTGAAGCATWIGGRDLRGWSRSPYPLILVALGTAIRPGSVTSPGDWRRSRSTPRRSSRSSASWPGWPAARSR